MTRRKTVGSVLCGIMLVFASVALYQTSLQQNVYAAEEADADTVMNVQNALNAAGYDCGTPDGMAGSQTIAAIQQYQEDNGLTASGEIDDELLLSLGISKEDGSEEEPLSEVESSQSAETENLEECIVQVQNYIGKNVASIGSLTLGGDIRERYNGVSMKITFISEDGVYIDPKNKELQQMYVVTDQMPEAGADLRVGYWIGDEGDEDRELVEDTSYEEILLAVKPVEDNGIDYEVDTTLTEINASPDKYTKYIPDYVGRNLASVGYHSLGGQLRAYAGESNYILNLITDDGSYVDPADRDAQSQYIITSQYPEPNTEDKFDFKRDSDGNEYSNLTENETVQSVDLYLEKLPQEVLDFQNSYNEDDEGTSEDSIDVEESAVEEETEAKEEEPETVEEGISEESADEGSISYAPDTVLTGTIIEATMNTVMIQTDDGSTYLCATEDTEFNLTSGGISLGLEVEVTLESTESDENGLFIADKVSEMDGEAETESEDDGTVYAPNTVLTGTIVEATMNTITVQTEDGSTYLCATEDTEFDLISGSITLGLEVEVTLESDASDEYGLFTADRVTELSGENEMEDEEETSLNVDSDRYIKHINNYVGKNVASIGYLSWGGEILDEYGSADIPIAFVSEDGTYLDPENSEQLQQYVVTGQMPAAGSEMRVTYQTDSEGEEYSNLTDDLGYDEIVLTVKPVEDTGIDYQVDVNLTEISPSPDKYTKYIADFVGRNLASCGYISWGGELRAESGHTSYKLNIITEDGSYIDPEDMETLMQYVVTSQYPEPNTENDLVFTTDSEGNEYSSLVHSSTVESVDLYVTKLPQEIIDAQPELVTDDEE